MEGFLFMKDILYSISYHTGLDVHIFCILTFLWTLSTLLVCDSIHLEVNRILEGAYAIVKIPNMLRYEVNNKK